jgi:glutamine---fructose-6-phosphate transaminase (isomerizing)
LRDPALAETARLDFEGVNALRNPSETRMFAEAGEASAVVAGQLKTNAPLMASLAARLRRMDPQIIFTCARGSSDHAATFAKYLFETQLGIPTLSQAPSISSIYGGALLHMKDQPFILVSQSGRSPDLLLSADAATKAGALVIAMVNDTESPLAAMADIVIPLQAGPETSVAATKSYIAALAAFAQLVSVWKGDAALASAVAQLPDSLHSAWQADWSAGVDMLADSKSLFVLGRGLTLGVAQEAALKFKETCGIHGEAFSIAEVAHGPMALVGPEFPVLVFPPLDKAAAGLDAIVSAFADRGAPIVMAGGTHPDALVLPVADGLHPVTGPIAMVQSFYRLVNALAIRRGFDPDHPPMLKKVTETR